MTNPFVTKGYAGPQCFCDREKETHDLTQLLTNENNMALISARCLGKLPSTTKATPSGASDWACSPFV